MSSDPKGPEPKTDAEKLEDLRYNRQSAHEEWLVAQAHIGGWRQAEAFLRQRAGEHFAVSDAIDRALAEQDATIDAQATEIAALKEALEELRQVYHHVVHRGELDECELLLCQRARRVLAGKGAQGA